MKVGYSKIIKGASGAQTVLVLADGETAGTLIRGQSGVWRSDAELDRLFADSDLRPAVPEAATLADAKKRLDQAAREAG